MPDKSPLVYIVDDDPSVREALHALVETAEFEPVSCSSGQEFLERFTADRPACLLLDIRMPDVNGLDLLDTFSESGIHIPTIIISGHGDIKSAVRAMRAGAIDFVEKPFRRNLLLERIRKGIAQDSERRAEEAEKLEFRGRLAQLTSREREILQFLVKGYTNKETAIALGISHRTVEAHRNKLMLKLRTDSLVELVREITTLGAH